MNDCCTSARRHPLAAPPSVNPFDQLPAEPQRDRDGQIVKDERGKPKYRSALRWRDRDLQDQFSRELIEAVERQYGPLADGP